MNDHASLIRKGYVLGANGYSRPDKALVAGPRAAEPEQVAGHRALGAGEDQAKGSGRRLLRFTAFRTRLVDPDNNLFKYECDALRYAGVLQDDSADHVEIVTRQVKVKSKAEVGTEIIIEQL